MLSEKLINASGAPTSNWDLSYATYDGSGVGEFRLTPQTTVITDLVFSTDGTKFYVLNSTTATIYQYSMPTAFDIGAASYDNKQRSISAQETSPKSIAFSTDGTKMYAVGSNSYVRYYTLSTPWDITTATYVSFMNPVVDNDINGIHFKPDGTIVYLTGNQNNRVYSIALATAWDIFSFSTDINNNPVRNSFILTTQTSQPKKTILKPDGTKMYVTTLNAAFAYEYTLSTAWDISTAVYSTSASVAQIVFAFTNDGNYVIRDNWIAGSHAYVKKSAVTTAWSLPVNYSLVNISSENGKYLTSAVANHFSTDGSKLYVAISQRVDYYTLSVPWNISTITETNDFYNPANVFNITDLYLKPDGTKMYLYNTSDYKIYQYSLSTPGNITTAISDNKTFTTPEISGTSMTFKEDGTKVFFTGTNNDIIYEYNLSTPWDISTSSLLTSFNFSSPGNPAGFHFKNDGSKIYIISSTNRQIYEYRLWINWSFSGGATLVTTYNASSFVEFPKNISFDSNGSNIYVLDSTQISTILRRIKIE